MKKKIIKIRPYNMANFSGGNGWLVWGLIFECFFLIPMQLCSFWYIKPSNKENPGKRKSYQLFLLILLGISLFLGTIFSFICSMLVYSSPYVAVWSGFVPFLVCFLSYLIGYIVLKIKEVSDKALYRIIMISFIVLQAALMGWVIADL